MRVIYGKTEKDCLKNILYFTDINFIKFIQHCFNILEKSIIIVLFVFIRIASLNNNLPIITSISVELLTEKECD